MPQATRAVRPRLDVEGHRGHDFVGATAALIKDGWHPHSTYPGVAYWNSIRAYTHEHGDTVVEHVNTKWVVQFPSDVPIRRVVAAANALADRVRMTSGLPHPPPPRGTARAEPRAAAKRSAASE